MHPVRAGRRPQEPRHDIPAALEESRTVMAGAVSDLLMKTGAPGEGRSTTCTAPRMQHARAALLAAAHPAAPRRVPADLARNPAPLMG